jgi:hypothetical protein
MRGEIPGLAGIVGLIAALGVACVCVTVINGTLFHWLMAAAAVVTSVWTVKAINR